MKNIQSIAAILTVIFCTPLVAAPAAGHGNDSRAARETKKVEKPKPYPLKTCIVSGDDLEEMGGAITFTHKGQEIKLCCKPCKKDFDKDPAKYLKQLEGK